MSLPVLIYGVIDPRSQELRYVGRTRNLPHRIKTHCKDRSDSTHRTRWFNSLRKAQVKPDFFIIEETTVEACSEAERFWIAYFRSIGARLVNCAEGGEGTILANRTSFRKGQRPHNAGKTYSEETRKRISEVQRGVPKGKPSEQHREALSKALKGKTKGRSWSDKRRATGQRPWTEEQRQRLLKLRELGLTTRGRKRVHAPSP